VFVFLRQIVLRVALLYIFSTQSMYLFQIYVFPNVEKHNKKGINKIKRKMIQPPQNQTKNDLNKSKQSRTKNKIKKAA